MQRVGPAQILCAVIEYGKQKPAQTIDDFLARTAEVKVPQIHRLLEGSKQLSAIHIHGNTQNRRRHYGRVPWFPEGLVILGDAVCALNPIFGQGITVALMSAERLDRDLSAHFARRGNLNGFGRRFQRSLEEVLKVPWQTAVMQDRLWVSVFSGAERTFGERLTLRTSQRVLDAVFSDVDAFIQFMRISHLLDSPLRMLSPKMLAAVLRGGGSDGASPEAPRVGRGSSGVRNEGTLSVQP